MASEVYPSSAMTLTSPRIEQLRAEIGEYQNEIEQMRQTGVVREFRPTTTDILGFKKKKLRSEHRILTPIRTDSRIGLEKSRVLAEPPQELRLLTQNQGHIRYFGLPQTRTEKTRPKSNSTETLR